MRETEFTVGAKDYSHEVQCDLASLVEILVLRCLNINLLIEFPQLYMLF